MKVNLTKFKVFPSLEKALIKESCCAGTPLIWFNVVAPLLLLQSLFHLPVFRRLVLNYRLSERILEKCKSHSVSPQIRWTDHMSFGVSWYPDWWLHFHRTRGTSPSCKSCAACSPSWLVLPAGLWIPQLLWSYWGMPSGPARPNRYKPLFCLISVCFPKWF